MQLTRANTCRWLVTVAITWACMGCPASQTMEGPPCNSDADCGVEESCRRGQCIVVQAGDSLAPESPPPLQEPGPEACATDNGGCGDPRFTRCRNETGAPPSCDDIDECATDNGGCGDPRFTRCRNETGAPPSCDDIDECATDNGGCGDPRFTRCRNETGAPPSCEDIDECATDNGGCSDSGDAVCEDQVGAPPLCRVARLTWAGTHEPASVVSLDPLSVTTSDEPSLGHQTFTVPIPISVDAIHFFELELLQGHDSSPTRVAWLGVSDTTTPFSWTSGHEHFSGWYWSGAWWLPDGTTDSENSAPLTSGVYRVYVWLEGQTRQIAVEQRSSGVSRGPFAVPAGAELRLMLLGQGGYALPSASLLHGGAVYAWGDGG